MANRASHDRQAVVRAAAAARRQEQRTRATATELAALRDELADLDARRAAALGRRDALVNRLRVAGYSWGDLARLAGTSRPALMKRSDTPGKQ